ncbi:MAG: efflux RND transporter periplasmic adaptor subunit [Opitutales bacterium]|jgi:multidrug efflux system membrane fusion protein
MKIPHHLHSRKAILGALGLLIIAIVGAVMLRSRGAAPPAAPPASPPDSVAAALEQRVTEWDEFSGRVEAIDRVEVRPQVSGMIVAVHFEDGQLVKQGDLLFTIDPRPFQAQLAQAEAVQAGAEAQLALAQTALNRSRRLIENHSIAQSELDQDNANLLVADASLKAAQAAVLTAKLNLDYTAITAPVGGRVSRAEITVGNLVGAGVTAPVLTTVVSVSPVYVDFDIDEQTFIRYSANGAAGNSGIDRIPVSMGLASEDGYPHQGHLQSIDNELDPTSGTMRVRAVFDNTGGELTPGLFARVRTGGSAAETDVLIDDKAVGTDQDKKYVLVVDQANKATYRQVTLGPMVNGLRVVRSGLSQGERIVVDGLQRVRPDDTVTPVLVPMDGDQLVSATP